MINLRCSVDFKFSSKCRATAIFLFVQFNNMFYFVIFFAAKNFPIAMLSRTMNNYTKDILEYVSFYNVNTSYYFVRLWINVVGNMCFVVLMVLEWCIWYKNQSHCDSPRVFVDCSLQSVFFAQKNCPGRIIILYDEDERIATVAATTMVERGFDNIFILSGGKLKVFMNNINICPNLLAFKGIAHAVLV